MSALGDLASALLPPEAGGPDPERVAGASRLLIDAMPLEHRAGLGAALVALEGAALARHRRTLGRLRHEQRASLLEVIARTGQLGAGAVDALKMLVLFSAGADAHAGEIAATANLAAPVRRDPPLRLLAPDELQATRGWDVIVLGSGAGGAFAARELAHAGLRVLVLEEGEHWDVRGLRGASPLRRFAALYRDAGATVALGRQPIAMPLGRAVGGTTVINSGTCYRPPSRVVRHWRERHGLLLAGEELEAHLDDVEATLGVAPVPLEVMGRNGRLALAGAERLGWKAGPLRRAAPGCRGACQCALGCPNNAKLGVHLTALPQACEAGAAIATGLRVERILIEDGRVVGIRAQGRDRGPMRLAAPKVVVACGAIETPALLRRSGVRHPRLGRNLSIHPAVGATAGFGEPVVAWQGVLQSAAIEELHGEHGILLEATSAPPGMGSMVTPGVGAPLVRRLAEAEHRASVGAMIADAPSGRVLGARRPRIFYSLARADARRLVTALGAIAEVMLAAGAEEVELGGGAPPVRSWREIAPAIEQVNPRALHLAAFHPTGTAAAGTDPAQHPVDPLGALRGASGVWVADASILPSCPGVNPQVSIMALAAGVARSAAAA